MKRWLARLVLWGFLIGIAIGLYQSVLVFATV